MLWTNDRFAPKLRAYSNVGSFLSVPAGSPSRGGDVTVYVWHKPPELVHSVLFCSCICFFLYGPFSCISFRQFFRQLSVFWLCSSGLISALLVLSTIHLFVKVSFSPDITPFRLALLQLCVPVGLRLPRGNCRKLTAWIQMAITCLVEHIMIWNRMRPKALE